MKGFGLFIVAKTLTSILFPLGFLYSLVTFRVGLSKYFKQVAISIDKEGNVIMGVLFNDVLRKRGGYKFGDDRDTVSRVLGINKQNNKLTMLGRFIAFSLNKIDPNHVEKASKDFSNDY